MPLRLIPSLGDVRDSFHGTVPLVDCPRAAPNPSMQPPKYTWKGHVPSATASKLGNTNFGVVTISKCIYRTMSSMAGVKNKVTPFPRSEVIGSSLLDNTVTHLR